MSFSADLRFLALNGEGVQGLWSKGCVVTVFEDSSGIIASYSIVKLFQHFVLFKQFYELSWATNVLLVTQYGLSGTPGGRSRVTSPTYIRVFRHADLNIHCTLIDICLHAVRFFLK